MVFRKTVGHRALGKCSTPTLTPLIERVKTRSGVCRREKLDHFDTIGGTQSTRTPGHWQKNSFSGHLTFQTTRAQIRKAKMNQDALAL